MSLESPRCPTCSASLGRTSTGDLDTWECPAQHGFALTMSEAYGQLQDDEIALAWKQAREGTAPDLPAACPMCHVAMRRIDLAFDSDEALEESPGDTENLGAVAIDVCVDCQVFWFDNDEFDQLPRDLENAAPSQEELRVVAEGVAALSSAIDEAEAARAAQSIDGRIDSMLDRSPALRRGLESVVGRFINVPDIGELPARRTEFTERSHY